MCLVDFGGERIKFIVRILDAIISGRGLGNELLNFFNIYWEIRGIG